MDAAAVIKKYYDAFNRKDWDGMLALLSDDVAHDANQGGREKGKGAFAAFLATMAAHYDEKLEDICIMAAPSGHRASAEFMCRGKYLKGQEGLPPARGQTYLLRVGAFFELKGEKITRVTNYYNLPDWIKQVNG